MCVPLVPLKHLFRQGRAASPDVLAVVEHDEQLLLFEAAIRLGTVCSERTPMRLGPQARCGTRGGSGARKVDEADASLKETERRSATAPPHGHVVVQTTRPDDRDETLSSQLLGQLQG